MPARYPSSEDIRWAILHEMAPASSYAFRIPRPALVERVADESGLSLSTKRAHDNFDRRMRDEIAWLRENHPLGARICTDQDDGGGYWFGTDDEVEAEIARERGRASTIFEGTRKRAQLLGKSEQEIMQPALI